MDDSAYRSDVVLPLAGARIHALVREGNHANFAMAAVWGGTILLVVVIASLIDGHVRDAVLPFVGLPIVIGGLLLAWRAHRRLSSATSSYRVHVAGARVVLEQTNPQAAYDVARLPIRATRYEWTVRASRGAMPTVTIELPTGSTLVVCGPMGVGWVNVGEEDFAARGPAPVRSRAPDARLDDAQAFDALRRAAA